MNLEQRISSFTQLGEVLRSGKNLLKVVEEAERQNAWFTRDNIHKALSYWGNVLNKATLEHWLERYYPALSNKTVSKRVGVIMAGNIPMVGFHDMLSVLLSGHHLTARLSSQDSVLIPAIAGILETISPGWAGRIKLTSGEIENPEAIIATGSNNTARYFNYYFAKFPHIIRKNRTAVAVLDGAETSDDLKGLATDIFSYFGLGCRNVSKLYLPEGYDIKPLHEALLQYQELFHHPKYRNNLDYYKSIYLVNRTRFLDGVFYLFIEAEPLTTPVAVLHYASYRNLDKVSSALSNQKEEIQCIVARKSLMEENHPCSVVEPGDTQQPSLSDYADGVDTMAFLLEII
jgi:hypothetical protein